MPVPRSSAICDRDHALSKSQDFQANLQESCDDIITRNALWGPSY